MRAGLGRGGFHNAEASKSSLYRREVADAAAQAVLAAIDRIERGDPPLRPEPRDGSVAAVSGLPVDKATGRSTGRPIPTELVLRKIRAPTARPACATPCLDGLSGCSMPTSPEGFPAGPATRSHGGRGSRPRHMRRGEWIGPSARNAKGAEAAGDACVRDGKCRAVRVHGYAPIRTRRTGRSATSLRNLQWRDEHRSVRGAQSCVFRRVTPADQGAGPDGRTGLLVERHPSRPDRSPDSPADKSWRNINAMNDLTRDIITTLDRLVVSVLRAERGPGASSSRSPLTRSGQARASCSIRTTRIWAISTARNTGPIRCRAAPAPAMLADSPRRGCRWAPRKADGSV